MLDDLEYGQRTVSLEQSEDCLYLFECPRELRRYLKALHRAAIVFTKPNEVPKCAAVDIGH